MNKSSIEKCLQGCFCVAGFVFWGAIASVPIQAAEAPIAVRNLAPAAHIYGIPRMLGTDIANDEFILTLNFEFANNFTSDSNPETAAFFDGETTVISFGLRSGLGERYEWGIEVPYVMHAGGGLDAGIEGFHDAFGFKDASRPNAPRNQIDYFIRHQGTEYVNFQSSQSHIGDVRIWGGRNLYSANGRTLTGRGLVKLPTGELKSLSGSEATDVALWLEYTDASLFTDFGVTFTAGGGVSYLGEGELAPDAQNNVVFFFHAGVNYQVNENFTLFAQLDGHSQLIDTEITELSDGTIQGTLGARVMINNKLWVDAAFIEDIRHQSAPDVAFQLLIGAKL